MRLPQCSAREERLQGAEKVIWFGIIKHNRVLEMPVYHGSSGFTMPEGLATPECLPAYRAVEVVEAAWQLRHEHVILRAMRQ